MNLITIAIVIGLIAMIGWNIVGIIKDIKKKKSRKEEENKVKDDNIN